MAILNNPKHERFAQEMAAGKSATDAYTAAGYRPDRKNAAKLRQRDDVSRRIAELLTTRDEMARAATEKAIEELAIDRGWVISKLVENARIALGEVKTSVSVLPKGKSEPIEADVTMRDAAAANRALELLGKELGMFIDRSENVNVVHQVLDDVPTAEEWEAEHSTAH